MRRFLRGGSQIGWCSRATGHRPGLNNTRVEITLQQLQQKVEQYERDGDPDTEDWITDAIESGASVDADDDVVADLLSRYVAARDNTNGSITDGDDPGASPIAIVRSIVSDAKQINVPPAVKQAVGANWPYILAFGVPIGGMLVLIALFLIGGW